MELNNTIALHNKRTKFVEMQVSVGSSYFLGFYPIEIHSGNKLKSNHYTMVQEYMNDSMSKPFYCEEDMLWTCLETKQNIVTWKPNFQIVLMRMHHRTDHTRLTTHWRKSDITKSNTMCHMLYILESLISLHCSPTKLFVLTCCQI